MTKQLPDDEAADELNCSTHRQQLRVLTISSSMKRSSCMGGPFGGVLLDRVQKQQLSTVAVMTVAVRTVVIVILALFSVAVAVFL